MKTLVIPVANSETKVPLLIFAYQTENNNLALKFIDRNTAQPKLSQNGTADKKLFTQNTLSGLFTSLQNKVESSSKPKDIITNDYSYTRCWSYSIFYPDGSLTIANWQCVTEVVITENPYHLLTSAYPINENGGGGGGGGGNGPSPTPEPLYCSLYTAADIIDMLENAQLEDVNTVAYNTGTAVTDENTGRITAPATPTWTVSEYPLGVTGKYRFKSYYSGVKFRTGDTDPSWKWEQFSFSSFSGSWEKVACTIDITIDAMSHSEARKNDYVFDGAISFEATVRTSIPTIPLSKDKWKVEANNKKFSFDAGVW